jgi:HlyD family secretion protein
VFLEREATRQEQLFKQGSVSLKEREDSARALASSQFSLDLTRARLPILEAAVDEAQANLASAQAALERSQSTLRETTIRCPIDGVVLVRDKEVGDGVSSILTAGGNATQLMSLGDLSRMHVEARIDEVDLGRIEEGMPALITIDAYRGKELTGRVERIAPAGSIDDNGIVTFEVRIMVEDPEGLLRPDMTADARLVIARRDDALVLPQSALRRASGGTWNVQRVLGEGEAQDVETVEVQVGLSDGLKTEVVDGLSEGDRVLAQPASPRGRR